MSSYHQKCNHWSTGEYGTLDTNEIMVAKIYQYFNQLVYDVKNTGDLDLSKQVTEGKHSLADECISPYPFEAVGPVSLCSSVFQDSWVPPSPQDCSFSSKAEGKTKQSSPIQAVPEAKRYTDPSNFPGR